MTQSAAFYILGTDTDVGKTVVTAGLLIALQNTQAIKPVQTGREPDEAVYARASPGARFKTLRHFQLAASPHLAAAKEGRDLNPDSLAEEIAQECAKAEFTLIEGAGGVFTPLNPTQTFLDLLIRRPFPVVVVIKNSLGAINQALLSTETLKRAGLQVAGLILNQTAPAPGGHKIILEDNLEIIPRLSETRLLSAIPYLESLSSRPDSPTGYREVAEHLKPAAAYMLHVIKEN